MNKRQQGGIVSQVWFGRMEVRCGAEVNCFPEYAKGLGEHQPGVRLPDRLFLFTLPHVHTGCRNKHRLCLPAGSSIVIGESKGICPVVKTSQSVS